jgi:phage baseplate assembly protein W
MEDKKSFLGKGWTFPPTFDNQSGSVRMVSDEKDIAESLRIILFTTFGERIMRPEFGSNLSNVLFSAVDSLAINRIKGYITQSILMFEPRVTLNEIEIETDQTIDGKLLINLDYTIRSINVRTNIVFPFYLKEGTNVTDI